MSHNSLSQNTSSLLCSLLLFQSTPRDICSVCVFSPFLGRAPHVHPARRFCSCSKCSFIISLMWSESELAAEWQILRSRMVWDVLPLLPQWRLEHLCGCAVCHAALLSQLNNFWGKKIPPEKTWPFLWWIICSEVTHGCLCAKGDVRETREYTARFGMENKITLLRFHNICIGVSAWELHYICVCVLERTDNVRLRIWERVSWLFISSACWYQ